MAFEAPLDILITPTRDTTISITAIPNAGIPIAPTFRAAFAFYGPDAIDSSLCIPLH